MQLSVIYFGTGNFAVGPLQALIDRPDDFKVLAVVTQPDRPAGRGGAARSPATAELAKGAGLRLLQPETLKTGAVLEEIAALKPDLFVVASYGKIIPAPLLRAPKLGALNLHGSLLPKYRGASPIQSAIAAGEKETGVTLMLMDAEMDHGPTLAEAKVAVRPDETYGSLEAKLSRAAAGLLIESALDFASGRLKPKEQEHELATYTKLISREDGLVDWKNDTAEQLTRKIRAFDPWPGLYTIWKRGARPLRIKIIKATEADVSGGFPRGTAVTAPSGNPAVITREGALELVELQPEGGKPMAGRDFLNGYKDFVGVDLAG